MENHVRIWIFLLISAFTLCGCSFFEKSRIESKANDQFLIEVNNKLISEAEQELGPHHSKEPDYLQFIKGRTSLKLVEYQELSPHHYSVRVRIKTIPKETRSILLKILKPLSGRAEIGFNFGDALKLSTQQNPSIESLSEEEKTIEVSD